MPKDKLLQANALGRSAMPSMDIAESTPQTIKSSPTQDLGKALAPKKAEAAFRPPIIVNRVCKLDRAARKGRSYQFIYNAKHQESNSAFARRAKDDSERLMKVRCQSWEEI